MEIKDMEETCGNCINRDGEECSLHCGREIWLDYKPTWCDDWEDDDE